METILYEYHFDYLQILPFLIPFIVGFSFFFIWKWYPAKNRGVSEKGARGHVAYMVWKYIGWIVGAFTVILGVFCLSAHIIDFQDKKALWESGNVYTVEGYTENYHAMPSEGHDKEHFEINGILFEYSNFEITNGYSQTAAYGGVITKDGQHLKIKYVTDEHGNHTILYIAEIT